MAKVKAFSDLDFKDQVLLRLRFDNAPMRDITQRTNLPSGKAIRQRYRQLWRELDPDGKLDKWSRTFLLRLWMQKGKDLPELASNGFPDEKLRMVGPRTLAKTLKFLGWFKQTYKE